MKLHHLKPNPGSKKAKIRVGRGEGGRRGKTAGHRGYRVGATAADQLRHLLADGAKPEGVTGDIRRGLEQGDDVAIGGVGVEPKQ